MKKIFTAVMVLGVLCSFAQTETDTLRQYKAQEVVLEGTKAGALTPVSFTEINKAALAPLNIGQDIPYLLRNTPGVTFSSDAGNGIGYTGLWIRGSDQTRINVTINGIPLNDPESQSVYWVNMPDFVSGVYKIQVQRGVGTSTNGAGSFGGTIKLETTQLESAPYAESIFGVGSYGTIRNTVRFGTGLIDRHWTLDGRLSRIVSNGYIDRASSRLGSYYLGANYFNDRTIVRLIHFNGQERTYQAWWGVPESRLRNDTAGMFTYALNNGLSTAQTEQLIGSGRTFNIYTYPGQTDNYAQNHFQIHVIRELTSRWKLSVSGHYTKGKGYYEEYRNQDSFSAYGLPDKLLASDTIAATSFDPALGYFNSSWQGSIQGSDRYQYSVLKNTNGDTLFDAGANPLVFAQAFKSSTDLVRQRWLDNDFFGVVYSFTRRTAKSETVIGGALNGYRGNHFGRLIWTSDGGVGQTNFEYYRGSSWKRDMNIYAKSTFALYGRFTGFVDLQLRNIYYTTSGIENGGRAYHVMDELTFVNPKIGITWRQNDHSVIYASCAVGNKEPNRNDYIDKAPLAKPKSEEMFDFEMGWRSKWLSANLYWMQYRNQLVLNGAVNDVGSALRTNVDRSYRRGLELYSEGSYRFISWNGTVSFSDNRIKQFNEVIPDYEVGDSKIVQRKNTPIAFSPSMIFSSQTAFDLLYRSGLNSDGLKSQKGLTFFVMNRYVGMQYLDNTGQRERTIPSYFVTDLRIQASKTFGKLKVELALTVNNTWNRKYVANGYTYTYLYGALINERMYFPQALRNYLVSLQVSF